MKSKKSSCSKNNYYIRFGLLVILVLSNHISWINHEYSEDETDIIPHAGYFQPPIVYPGTDIEMYGAGTELDPYVFEYMEINASAAHGIELRGIDGYVEVRYCTIVNGSMGYNDGIYLTDISNVKIYNNTLLNNQVGIRVIGSPNAIIFNNTVENGGTALLVSASHNSSIYSNDFHGNLGNGISLYATNDTLLINNTLKDNGQNGINLENSSENNIINNLIVNNSQSGVNFYDRNELNDIAENNIENNSQYGVYMGHWSSRNTIWGNNISDNLSGQAINVTDFHEINYWSRGGLGNYWGDYTEKYSAISTDTVMYDTPYEIEGGLEVDPYPMVHKIIPDIDSDNLTNVEEVLIYGTDPKREDSDEDGFSDYYEIVQSTDPTDSNDFPIPEDDEIPVWLILPVNQTVTEGESFSFMVNATDNVAIDQFWVLPSTYFQIDTQGVISNRSILSVGEYSLTVGVNDTSGNSIEKQITIIVLPKSGYDGGSVEQISGFPIGVVLLLNVLGMVLFFRKSQFTSV